MPNFHKNCLAIAANDEDMCKVLIRFAANFDAHYEKTGLELRYLRYTDDVRKLYQQLGGFIDSEYPYAFAGTPDPDDVDAAGFDSGLTADSAQAYLAQMELLSEAIKSSTGNAGSAPDISGMILQPTARHMSDTACVRLSRRGSFWVLSVLYSTAWVANHEDLDSFFRGLPKGLYGVVFYDADESDGYEKIDAAVGLHHGGGHALWGCSDIKHKCMSRDDLGSYQLSLAFIGSSRVSGLVERARAGAALAWGICHKSGFEGVDESIYGDESPNSVLGEIVSGFEGGGYSRYACLDWLHLTERDLKDIDWLILNNLHQFPWFCHCMGWSAEGIECIERMLPGDSVRVCARWLKPMGVGGVSIFANNDEGVALARVETTPRFLNSWEGPLASAQLFACLLPHLKVSVTEVKPRKSRDSYVDSAYFTLRFDLEPIDVGEVLEGVRRLLSENLEDRTMFSKGEE